ncbi:MAG: hypothetical protein A2Z99_09695 [Treponema sp. GWB1_62_6]|nr:MAG: hypothetical protein A2001_04650 [Treponema sp. GWC1_61_84]OHE68423.1 MAG: hypothetical protein A2Z99_09695 [Treponema sp. GWB1_62_6]
MRWTLVRPEQEASARAFLAARERYCVSAASRFLERDAAVDRAWLATGKDGAPRAFAFLTKAGFLFPVIARRFREGTAADAGSGNAGSGSAEFTAAVGEALGRILAFRTVRAVQGLAEDVAIAERLLVGRKQGPAPDAVDYDLMELGGPPSAGSLAGGPAGLLVRRAFPSDADGLFPLQRDYELEEVVPRGGSFNPAACRLSLDSLIARRLVLVAELGGEFVGKANVNASAFLRDQIGGVYVLPDLRGLGIGTRLSAELAALIAAQGRTASLFVKKDNAAARAAYRQVGFKRIGDYRIAYSGRS